MSDSSKLLINEPPLQALPTLAKLLDLNKAVILQQIQYWIGISGHEIDGYRWIYNSYTEWAQQFPWLTPRGVRWHIKGLEEAGLLVAGEYNKDPRDNTKWYRLDYDKLNELLNTSGGMTQSVTPTVSKRPVQVSPSVQPLPETTTETNLHKTTKRDNGDKPHPSQVKEVLIAMQSYYGFPEETDIDPIPNYGKEGKAIKRMIDRGFTIVQILDCWMAKCKKAGMFKSMVYVNEDIDSGPVKKNPHDKYIRQKYGHMVQS